jgi:hypothetical protein
MGEFEPSDVGNQPIWGKDSAPNIKAEVFFFTRWLAVSISQSVRVTPDGIGGRDESVGSLASPVAIKAIH